MSSKPRPKKRYRVLERAALGNLRDERQEFALNVLEGLSERPKRLSSEWFYDDLGSELFSRIMDLPQYYLTDCEREILESRSEEILQTLAAGPFDVVELGAGDGRKTDLLLRHLGSEARYVPIDISEAAIEGLVERLEHDFPHLAVEGLVAEYSDGLRWLQAQPDRRQCLVLFLGSNIGNFNKAQARAFLRRMWTVLEDGDHALIGFDLKKDIDLLLSAYNDPQGVTADFNLNLLTRINDELDGSFDLDQFRHFGTYNVFSGAMESYLVSQVEQAIKIGALNQSFHFEPWEPIHTEYSYKYLPRDLDDLANATGYKIVQRFRDRRGWFTDSVWRIEKPA